MTNFSPQPSAAGVVRLRGTIRNLKVTRGNASFVFTAADQSRLGILAVASALAGLDGQAAASSHYASDLEEAADFIEFDLDGQPVKGWVWRNPFRDGDAVHVAAERVEDRWEAFGILRPADRTLALYPHCSRGRATHYKNAVKWWLLAGGGSIVLVFFPGMYALFGNEIFQLEEPWIAFVCLMAAFGVMTFFLTRKWLPFVRVAERVFRTLGLPDPSNIDLVKSSKAQRKASDPGEFGTFYFRY
jgi:hypothetical protein